MIENVNRDDLEDIYKLICELEQETLPKAYFENTFLEAIEDSKIHLFVYRYEQKVIGYISFYVKNHLHHSAATGEIVELVVLPEYRGLKVGHRLIEYVENKAKELGLIEIDLSTSTYRKKAHHFYEAHGFIKDHYNYTKDI